MRVKNKFLIALTVCFLLALSVSAFTFTAKADTPDKNDFGAGPYFYCGEFAEINQINGVTDIIEGTGQYEGLYFINFRHGYLVSDTNDYKSAQSGAASVYYATGGKKVTDGEGTEVFNSVAEIAMISRDYGLGYINGYGATMYEQWNEFHADIIAGTLEDAPLLAGKPYNLGIVQNLPNPTLNEMSGVFFRYGDSTAAQSVKLGNNSSMPVTDIGTTFVSVTGNNTDGWKFTLLKDEFLQAYGSFSSSGIRLGKAIGNELKVNVEGIGDTVIQPFQYGYLYKDGAGKVQVDISKYYDLESAAFKIVPVQAYIMVPSEFGDEVGELIEKDGTYYQNYELGVAVGTAVKNGYDFTAKANYNYNSQTEKLEMFSDAKIDAYIDNITFRADAVSHLEASISLMQNMLRNAIKTKFKDLLKGGFNPGVPSGDLMLVSGCAEGINEYSVTKLLQKAVYFVTVGGDSNYSISEYLPNVAYVMVSKNDDGYNVNVVKDEFLSRYSAVMGSALSDITTLEINGVTYDKAQIYENAFVVFNKTTNAAEAHLQYTYDFTTKKATINRLTKEQLAYVLDYGVYGIVRWKDDTIDQINEYYNTNVTTQNIIDAMYDAYVRYCDAGYNLGLPYGEGIMWFGNAIKIGFTGSDKPGLSATGTKEVAYLLYNPQMNKAFAFYSEVAAFAATGFATSSVDTLGQVGAPTCEMTTQEDGTVYQNFTTGSAVCIKGKQSFCKFFEGKEWTGSLDLDEDKNAMAVEQAEAREKEWKKNPDYVKYLKSLSQATAEALAGLTVLAALKFCI